MLILNFVAVFFMTWIVDWMWGMYIIHTADRRPLKSALYASALTVVGGFVTILFIGNNLMLIPAALGGFVGTYLTVKHSK